MTTRLVLIGFVLSGVATSALAQSPSAVRQQAAPIAQDALVLAATDTTWLTGDTHRDLPLFALDAGTLRLAAAQQPTTGGQAQQPTTGGQDPPIADDGTVRRIEAQIQRQVDRFRAGVRAGVALDPELFVFGAHIQVGPFFHERVWARPNIEIGVGEVTTVVAFNFEAIFLGAVADDARWATYYGGGPAMNFTRQSFEAEDENGGIDFSDFNLDVGFNVLAGVQARGGLFLELKATAYSNPTLRFVVGYNF